MANDQHEPDDRRVVSLAEARDRAAREVEKHKPPREPILRLPPMVKTICAVITACFVVQQVTGLFSEDLADAIVFWGGFIPARYAGGLDFGWAALWTPLTHMFLHAGFLHIGINLGMLMAFGAGLEQQRGGRYLLILFIVSGLGGALLQLIFYPQSMSPMIGASGGISGLFGAALMEMVTRGGDGGPMSARLRRLAPFVAVWVVISVFFGLTGMPGVSQPVAWAAHIGGFFAGLGMAGYLTRHPQT